MIGVIINPRAKVVAADSRLSPRLAEIGGKFVVVREATDLEQLRQALIWFRRAKVGVVAACGGDGTNRTILTEMMRVYREDALPRLCLPRGGTVNTVADNLGLRGRPEQILSRLVAWHERGVDEPTELHPVLRVNEHVGFMFGAAMSARFFEAYYSRPTVGLSWRGFGGAGLLAARVTLSALFGTPLSKRMFAPVPACVRVDGRQLPRTQWTLLVAATVANVGLNVKITYRARERERYFHLVASGLSPFQLARQFPKTLIARSLHGVGHYEALSQVTEIEFQRPEPYIMDGDIFRASRLVLAQGPRVRLSVP